MPVFDSVEVRWMDLLAGSQQSDLNQYLLNLRESGNDVDVRPDHYVYIPGAHDFGLKVRGSELNARGEPLPEKLEFKGRTQQLGTQVFPKNVVGRVECWTKWSYESADALAFLGTDHRQLVNKTRLQVKFGYDDRFRLRRLSSAKEKVSKGGAFEITLVDTKGKSYWTIGIEAFPADIDTVSRFPEFAHEMVRFMESEKIDVMIPFAQLNVGTSHSYPSWLSSLP